MKKLFCLLSISTLVAIAGVGCQSIPKTTVLVPRISQPPPGKALVNFHRPSNFGGRVAGPIFDGKGKMLIDLPGRSLFQYVCDPGEQIFITWADYVTVVKAELAPDKVYDIVADTAAGWYHPGVILAPLSKSDSRRAKLAEFAKREKNTLGLNPASPRVADYQGMNQARIAEIKADFLGGPKSDRLKQLQKDDCR
jgi:hypothetical protein